MEEEILESIFTFDNKKFSELDEDSQFSLLLTIHQIYSEQLTKLILQNNSHANS